MITGKGDHELAVVGFACRPGTILGVALICRGKSLCWFPWASHALPGEARLRGALPSQGSGMFLGSLVFVGTLLSICSPYPYDAAWVPTKLLMQRRDRA